VPENLVRILLVISRIDTCKHHACLANRNAKWVFCKPIPFTDYPDFSAVYRPLHFKGYN